MNSNPQNRSPLNSENEAAEWIIRRDHGFTANQQDAFNDWLTRDVRNRQAYAKLSHSWDELDRLAGLQSSNRAPVNPDLLDHWTPSHRRANRLIYWSSALPIAAMLLIAFGIFFKPDLFLEPDPVVTQQQMVFERVRRQSLEDGSEVILNRGAMIHVEYTESARIVRLLSGEANFNVAKNTERPFWVEARGVKFRAVGTAFSVRISKEDLNVIVTEGTVAVETGLQSETPEPYLEANHRAVVSFHSNSPDVEIEELHDNSIEAELLWIPKLIDFEDVPLRVIVNEFNRRNPVNIVFHDPELEALHLSSVFWSDNVAGFVRLLEVKFGIQAVSGDDDTVYLMLSPGFQN